MAASRRLRANRPTDRPVWGAGGWGELSWLHGQHTVRQCPVCGASGPHSLVLSVPSSAIRGSIVTFAQCRDCHCAFVIDFQPPTYETTSISEASLRFYVEQGAGFDTFARTVFVAAQKPVRNFLDVGCGFGFGVDMASRMYGWNAVGIDPGPLAAAGQKMLGIRLDRGALSAGRLDEPAYDAIASIEVLEHITEPHAFLAELRGVLSGDGTLVLSTPNARYLETDPGGELLLPVLSAGYHAILYTAQGLTDMVRRAGFQNVSVAESAASLFVVASPCGWLPRLSCEIDRAAYVGYLRARFAAAGTAQTVHMGFGQRLLRCLVDDHAYDEALAVFEDLRDAILTTYSIDIQRPLEIADRTSGMRIGFEEVPDRYPFCLPGLLACRGSIAVEFERRPYEAASYFLAASFTARMLLDALDSVGIRDGDLAALQQRVASELTGALQRGGSQGGPFSSTMLPSGSGT